MATEPTLVLVHGAWHGAWCWTPFRKVLADRGTAAIAVELTSHGTDASTIGDLRTDTAELRSTVTQLDGPVVVLAHSAYGGVVASEALDEIDTVEHLIFLTSFAPEVGESLSDLFGDGGGAPPFVDAAGGLLTVKDGWGRRLFYSDCPEEVAMDAEQQLEPQAARTFGQPVLAAAWRDLPTSYIVCTEDRAMPPDGQRRIARRIGGDVVELHSGHSPFLSRPGELADLVGMHL